MVAVVVQFLLSALAIAIAGVVLTLSADKIAELTKLGHLLVGSVFLAAATSLPELFVDISAVRANMSNLAVGDLLGSSLFNLLILAIADLMHRGKHFFSKASAKHALSASMSISVTALAGGAILLGQQLAPYAIGEFGIGALAIVVAYILGLRMIYFDQRARVGLRTSSLPAQINKRDLSHALIGYLLSAIVILIAAPFLADAAGQIADISGLGKTFIGTTLVALCTSLPELVSTLSAVRLGAFDLALGNIFGSNAFNMILIAPLDWLHKGSILASVSKIHVFTSFAIILITSVSVMGQLYQVEKRKRLIEPDALLVILLVLGSLAVLYFFKDG